MMYAEKYPNATNSGNTPKDSPDKIYITEKITNTNVLY